MAGIYCRFIPTFSSKAAPLTGLTKKVGPNSVKDWKDHHEQAFQTMKDKVTSSPLLCSLVFQKGNRLFTSDTGLGAVLLHDFEVNVVCPQLIQVRKGKEIIRI